MTCPDYSANSQVFAVVLRFHDEEDGTPGEEYSISFSTEANAIAFYDRRGARPDVKSRKYIGPTDAKFPRKPVNLRKESK